jgi:hypothetical protein
VAEKFYPTRHTTIGSIIDAGLRIHAFCLDCGHDQDLDLGEVARRLGRKHSSLPVHLVPKLICSNCGSKSVGTLLAPADKPVPPDQIDHIRRRKSRHEE